MKKTTIIFGLLSALILIILTSGTIVITNSILKINSTDSTVTIYGDLAYNFSHGIATYGDSTAGYTPAVAKLVYTKLKPTFTVSEAEYITMVGDSITVTRAGCYKIEICGNITGANPNKWRLALYKNGAMFSNVYNTMLVSTTGAANYIPFSWFWYDNAAVVGDDYSLRITNTTNSDDPTFWRLKLYVSKMPE